MTAPAPGSAPMIEMKGITKTFPGVRALSDVSFDVRAGEVQALVGENGAGKSTLIKILSGVYRADSGAVLLNGEPVHFAHPVESLRAGIAVIYQEFSLLPERTVAQNLFLGREPRTRFGLIDGARMRRETREVLSLFAAAGRIDPDRIVGTLDVATQQVVEIAKAVSTGARVVVMDEPTAALNEAECEELFATVDTLRTRGVAIIYITHRMREIARLADRVTVLKDGEVAARFDEVPEPAEIVRAMVGRDIADFYAAPATAGEIGPPVLTVRGGGNAVLKGIDLEVKAGEIVGLAGIQGAGRVALAMALFGQAPFERGEVTLSGERVDFRSPRAAILGGVGLLPGDRKSEGLVLMQSVRDNGMLTSRAFAPLWASDRRNAHADTTGMDGLLDRMEIRAASYDQDIRALSGGNQQKAIVARWLSMRPKLLIFIEPTRGIDVNAKAGIYHLMRDLAREGAGILMISSDLPEVIGAADRVLVMQEGRIVAAFGRGASEQEIMHAATGGAEVAA
ncbi:sugar ABC transporter ATP-binding protein [Oceaniglobus roseus]|uniref:sugar ABC transporter ATP-binding protein n=1 Tax=Oceaniglobus roseus TaxID=1737570 RepID=UPI001C12A638|nr:sugar ABC transporter ATP-binding protein [Kandeliimicrobium roseum]